MRDGAVRDRDHRRRPGRPRGRVLPGEARPAVRDPRRRTSASATVAQALGLAAPVHARPLRRPARHGASRRRAGRSRPRTRWPTTSRPTPRASSCRSAPASRSTALGRTATASSSRPASAASRPTTSWSRRARTECRVPAFAGELDPGSVQLHSSDIGIPRSCRTATSSWSGAGNSGPRSPLSCRGRTGPGLAGRDRRDPCSTRHRAGASRLSAYPVPQASRAESRHADRPEVGPKLISKGDPLIRTKTKDLVAAGVERVPRVVGVRNGRPVLEDERVLMSPTSSGAPGSGRTSGGSTSRSSGTTASRSTIAVSLSTSPACTSSALSSSIRSRPTCSPGLGRDAEYIAKHIARSADSRLPRQDVAQPHEGDELTQLTRDVA